MTPLYRLFLCLTLALGSAFAASGQTTAPDPAIDPDEDPRFGLLTPRDGIPPIVDMMDAVPDHVLAERARAREYAQQIRLIKRKHFGRMRNEAIRTEGLALIEEFTDPAAFRPLIEELRDEQDDVLLALLQHLGGQGDAGQAALAWMAIYERDAGLRNEAMMRLIAPPPDSVLRIVDSALRSGDHDVANAAGTLAGALNIIDSIPLLIFAQAATTGTGQTGDLAWIAFENQVAYVRELQPVVGDNSGAFQPVIGVVSSGSILRIVDAVVIVYRTEIHHVLVQMTSQEYGEPTDHLGYDIDAWWDWYNSEFLPHLAEQQKIDDLVGEEPSPPAPGASFSK